MAKKKKHPKLPNGFGSIKKLSGNRSNPYAVYPPTKTWDKETGSPKTQKALCYVRDWYTGFHALMEYHNGTFDSERFSTPVIKDTDNEKIVIQKILAAYNNNSRTAVKGKTFSEVYEDFFEYKYERDKTKEYSKASIYSTRAAYKNCLDLHERDFRSLRTEDLQEVIDACPLKHASKELMVSLMNQMYEYADSRDLCDKKYSDYVKINTPDDDEPGVPFSPDELKKIWDHSKDNTIIQGILIMIYSGFRISSYTSLEINMKDKYFKGGLKTPAGKDRIVPFCHLVDPFIQKQIELFTLTSAQFRKLFTEELERIGIKNHTPHDCRHTFSWLCDKYKVDKLTKKMLMGHSLGKDVTDAKYGHRTLLELTEEINKIQK